MKIKNIIITMLVIFLLVSTTFVATVTADDDYGGWGGGDDYGNWGGDDYGSWSGSDSGSTEDNDEDDLIDYLNGNNPDTGNNEFNNNQDTGSNHPNPFDDDDGGDEIDYPAHWDTLENQQIRYDTPDDTVVYADLQSRCDDEDTPFKEFRIVSQHEGYELFFSGSDLLIRNLDEDYLGDEPYRSETVTVECNKVKASFTLTVVGNGAPIAQFTYSPSNPVVGDKIQFTDLSYDLDGYIQFYSWDFGDGESCCQRNPVHTYNKAGSYEVTLTVWDNEGLSNSLTQVITVAKIPGPEPTTTISDRTIFKRIRFSEFAQAGDVLDLDVTISNDGTYEMEDLKVTAYIFGLESIQTVGPFDVEDDDEENALFHLDIPADAQPGTYDLRITASNDDFQHNEHRTITII